MTKQQRLSELKEQDKLYKCLDKIFDAGWRNWVKEIHRENDISNIRMFKILSSLKGADFVIDLIKLMGKRNKSALLKLTKHPKGILLKDNRFATIPEMMLEKYPSGSYREGKVHIQVREDRWISFVF